MHGRVPWCVQRYVASSHYAYSSYEYEYYAYSTMHIKESIIRARSTTEVVLSMHTPLVPSMHFLNKYSRGTSTSLEYAYTR